MNTYAIYQLIKSHISGIAPVWYYTGQYARDKNKTVYKVPALYIEMPATLPVSNFGQIRMSKQAEIKLHYLSQAPFGSTEIPVQDSAVQAHTKKILELVNLVSGAELKDRNGNLVAGQCLVTGVDPVKYTDTFALSVVRINADLYDYSGVTLALVAPNKKKPPIGGLLVTG